MTAGKTTLIVGAGGPLGFEMAKAACDRGARVIATYRSHREGLSERLSSIGAEPRQLDLHDDDALRKILETADLALFTPILTIAQRAAPYLRSGARALFMSSNNVGVDPSSSVYAALRQAETDIAAKTSAETVILRPTMIYGHSEDGNLARLMKVMRRWPIIPVPGSGRAYQQPVFYADLARIAVDRVAGPGRAAGVCAVAGPTPVTTRALYHAVAAAAGRKIIVAPIPLAPLRAVVGLAERIGIEPPLSRAQLDRAESDRLPATEPVIYGETSLDKGLQKLAHALDNPSLDGCEQGA
ncbi:MAG: NmrA family NAD(P)-binding protein [Pseudomonadota bacterium]